MTNRNEESLFRRALRLEYFTVGYNMLEAAAAFVAGIIAAAVVT